MTFGTQFHMPGSFHFEGPGAPTTASTTLNANIFRPPPSPSSSSYNLAKSTGSLLSDTSMATGGSNPAPSLGRKRTHDESTSTRGFPFPRSNLGGARDSPFEDDARGAPPRYTLAGQIETPGAQITPGAGAMEDSLYSDIDYRRSLGPKRQLEDEDGGQMPLVNPETGEPFTPREAGWTTFAFQAIGGVVGKVWEFCRGGPGAFRGFQAGGGKAYEFNGQPIPTLAPGSNTPTYGAISPAEVQVPPNSPPGAYPAQDESPTPRVYQPALHESNPMPDYFQEKTRQTPVAVPNPFKAREPSPDTALDRPAAKRRQTGPLNEGDELKKNWVMVEEDEVSPSPANMTPNAKRASPAMSRIPASSRSNVASRLQQSPRFSTPNAGRRLSALSPRFSEKSNIPTRASGQMSAMASPASFAGGNSPSLGPREPASYASPRSPSRISTPNPFTPNGSRIPAPKGFGPNPFANGRTSSPAQARFTTTASRPTSRGSVQLNPSPFTQNAASRIATPKAGHRKTLSNISIGSARGARTSLGFDDVVEKAQLSPRLDDEGRQLATKKFATEKRNYSRLDKLNMELQDLIKQGQEALGTTVDVDMDEGWED